MVVEPALPSRPQVLIYKEQVLDRRSIRLPTPEMVGGWGVGSRTSVRKCHEEFLAWAWVGPWHITQHSACYLE